MSAPTRPDGARSIDELLADARAGSPASPRTRRRPAEATGYDLDVVVLCSEGCTSSLAAHALRTVGLHRAADVVGGFVAWEAPGLPTTAAGSAR